jgi:predicted DNA-binding transcriptional regulator AlpA
MQNFSTRQAARKLGISMASLSRYVADGKVPAPNPVVIGRYEVRAWTEADIERVREILPKIANGRKTRHKKQRKKQTKRKSKP